MRGAVVLHVTVYDELVSAKESLIPNGFVDGAGNPVRYSAAEGSEAAAVTAAAATSARAKREKMLLCTIVVVFTLVDLRNLQGCRSLGRRGSRKGIWRLLRQKLILLM